MRHSWIDLSHRIAEFNISLAKPMRPRRWSRAPIGCIRKVDNDGKQEENRDAAEVAFACEMNEDQKQTYDESIAGKRGAPPPPMMAWLNSPEMARQRHPPRRRAALRHDLSGQTVGDRHSRHRAALGPRTMNGTPTNGWR